MSSIETMIECNVSIANNYLKSFEKRKQDEAGDIDLPKEDERKANECIQLT